MSVFSKASVFPVYSNMIVFRFQMPPTLKSIFQCMDFLVKTMSIRDHISGDARPKLIEMHAHVPSTPFIADSPSGLQVSVSR